jgi:YVTN family beta-propeller protein
MTDASWSEPGDGPRHLVLSPDGRLLYVTNNSSGNVVKLDAATGEALGSVGTGVNARSMDISTDGEALYVVNYKSETLSKVRTSDMTVVQEVATNPKPIGITYEPTLRRVWVANYSGTLQVFDDSHVLAD